MLGRRVMVVGTTGSGKSTLAGRLAARLGVPHVELDALRHGPGWTEVPDEQFRPLVAAAVAVDGWVVDGNYDSVRDLVLPRATDVIWLDYPRRVVMWRVVKRSIVRAVTRRKLWNGNREDWREWARPDHPIRWAWSSHRARRVEYEALSAGDPRWQRIRSPRALSST